MCTEIQDSVLKDIYGGTKVRCNPSAFMSLETPGSHFFLLFLWRASARTLNKILGYRCHQKSRIMALCAGEFIPWSRQGEL